MKPCNLPSGSVNTTRSIGIANTFVMLVNQLGLNSTMFIDVLVQYFYIYIQKNKQSFNIDIRYNDTYK